MSQVTNSFALPISHGDNLRILNRVMHVLRHRNLTESQKNRPNSPGIVQHVLNPMVKMLRIMNRVIEIFQTRNFTESNFPWEIGSFCRHLLTGLRSNLYLEIFSCLNLSYGKLTSFAVISSPKFLLKVQVIPG